MANYNMIKKYAYINQEIIDILEKIDEPTTVIYNDVKNLKTFSNSIGIRIPKDSFCYNLLSQFKKPIVSTSVNMSGDDFAVCFEDINKSILQEVDFAVNLRRNEKLVKASKIIKINKDNSITTIRS
jgi:L-threonylcarbamoyladenylate synthase